MKSTLKIFHSFEKTIFFNFFCYIWTAGLGALAFAPFGLTHLVWFAPFGLFWIERKYRGQYKKLFKQGLWFAIFFSSFSFYWLNYMFVLFGGLPIWLAVTFFILYSMAFNLQFNVHLLLQSFLMKKLGVRFLLIPGFVILLAELFTYQVFPWHWGNILAGDTIFAQNAEIVGVYGLSFLVFTASYALFHLPAFYTYWQRQHQLPTASKVYLLIPLTIVVVFYANGRYLFHKWQAVSPTKKVNVMMIQPDAPLEFRDGRSFQETMQGLMRRIESLAIKGAKALKPEIIVLPESSVPFFSTNNSDATNSFHRTYWYRFEALAFLLANRFQSNVFLNEINAFFKNGIRDSAHQRMQNNSVLFDPNGSRKNSYAKSYLLVFGEYIPFGEQFEILYSIIPQIGRFMPGKEQKLIPYYRPSEPGTPITSHISWKQTKSLPMRELQKHYALNRTTVQEAGKILPLICYEVILPEFVRKFRHSGESDFIINITNDKWYGRTVESYQHLELARIRSIEYRKWMVRSTNSGTSAFVDHLGRIVDDKFTNLLSSTVYSHSVPVIRSGQTFYVRYGNLLAYIFLVVMAFYYIYSIQRRMKKN
ncbi:MAG: nitrilase-related carbon-nitrogen hydrolase [Spirochaetota bacterium]